MTVASLKKAVAQGRARVLAGCVILAIVFAALLPWLFQWALHLSPDEASYTRRAFFASRR